MQRKGKPCMPPTSGSDAHVFVLPPNAAGTAQLKQRLNTPVAPFHRPSFLAAQEPPLQAPNPALQPLLCASTLQPAPRPLLPAARPLLPAVQPQTLQPAPRRHLPAARPLLPAVQHPLPAAQTLQIVPRPLLTVPYTTQLYHKRKLQEEEQTGKTKRTYTRKTSTITRKQCQREQDPATHQQYFSNWYCQGAP